MPASNGKYNVCVLHLISDPFVDFLVYTVIEFVPPASNFSLANEPVLVGINDSELFQVVVVHGRVLPEVVEPQVLRQFQQLVFGVSLPQKGGDFPNTFEGFLQKHCHYFWVFFRVFFSK